MKATELRIGNWVYDTTRHIHVQVEDISFDYVNGNSRPIHLDNVKAIKLTEQWILDFAFGKVQNIYQRFNQILLEPEPNGDYKVKFWTASISKAEPLYQSDLKISKVHQLQNLYFALTGVDLTI